MFSKLINKFKKKKTTETPMTSQESETIDLAEKGMQSPMNPRTDGMNTDVADQKTVLKSVKKTSSKKTPPKKKTKKTKK